MADAASVLARLKKFAAQPWYCDTRILFEDTIALIESQAAELKEKDAIIERLKTAKCPHDMARDYLNSVNEEEI